MDWKNIDMNSAYERDQSIVNAYSTNDLLLEVNCNLTEITPATVMAQFEEALSANIDSARQVMADNLDNIVKEAIRYRKIP